MKDVAPFIALSIGIPLGVGILAILLGDGFGWFFIGAALFVIGVWISLVKKEDLE